MTQEADLEPIMRLYDENSDGDCYIEVKPNPDAPDMSVLISLHQNIVSNEIKPTDNIYTTISGAKKLIKALQIVLNVMEEINS